LIVPKASYDLRVQARRKHQEPDASYALTLLRSGHDRPSRRAAKAGNEFAPSHLQSSSFKIDA
jgi:hypothetical protein